jgi:hypothetical protein
MTIEDYNDGFDRMDQRSYHVAYWLMRQQDGEKNLGLANCADAPLVAFMLAFTKARVAEADEAKAKADAEKATQDAALDAGDRATAVGPTGLLPGDPPSPASGTPTATTPQPVEPQVRYLPPPPGYDPGNPTVS